MAYIPMPKGRGITPRVIISGVGLVYRSARESVREKKTLAGRHHTSGEQHCVCNHNVFPQPREASKVLFNYLSLSFFVACLINW